jgi:hypothetical protein
MHGPSSNQEKIDLGRNKEAKVRTRYSERQWTVRVVDRFAYQTIFTQHGTHQDLRNKRPNGLDSKPKDHTRSTSDLVEDVERRDDLHDVVDIEKDFELEGFTLSHNSLAKVEEESVDDEHAERLKRTPHKEPV